MRAPYGSTSYRYRFRVVLGVWGPEWTIEGEVTAASREEAQRKARKEVEATCQKRSAKIPGWRQDLLAKLTIEVNLMGPTAL